MEDQSSTNQIDTNASEIETNTNNIENQASEKEVPEELTLKEKVFLTCDNMHKENKKITRRSVRSGTGGSDRDVQKYINEWHQSKSLEVPEGGEIVVQTPSSPAKNEEQQPEKVVPINSSNYIEQPKEEASNLARRISERAAAMLFAEEMGVQFLLDNPDKLPEDLKEMVAQARSGTATKIEARSSQYQPDFFAETVMAQFQ